MLDTSELTPVELIGDSLFKRDDLYLPFNDIPLSGGKVRQAINLFQENLDTILTKHNKHVVTTNSIQSPQGVIIARCCKEFGVKFTMVINGLTTKFNTLLKHNIIKHILNLDGIVDFSANCNWDAALVNYAKKKYPESFLIKFGINVKNSTCMVDCNANQTRNLPKEIENLIIPVGSGITMAGILKGIKQNNIKVKRVIGVQISGHDYRKVIDNIVGLEYYRPYEYIVIGSVKQYSTEKEVRLENGVILDPLYEAKVYDYILNNRKELLTKDSVFWIVGNAFTVKHEFIAKENTYSCSDKMICLSEQKN